MLHRVLTPEQLDTLGDIADAISRRLARGSAIAAAGSTSLTYPHGSGCTYPNGRRERSHTNRSDLNVPLALSCELVGAGRWSHASAG